MHLKFKVFLGTIGICTIGLIKFVYQHKNQKEIKDQISLLFDFGSLFVFNVLVASLWYVFATSKPQIGTVILLIPTILPIGVYGIVYSNLLYYFKKYLCHNDLK